MSLFHPVLEGERGSLAVQDSGESGADQREHIAVQPVTAEVRARYGGFRSEQLQARMLADRGFQRASSGGGGAPRGYGGGAVGGLAVDGDTAGANGIVIVELFG